MTAPAALQWSVENCTIQRTLDVIGDRWSLLVLREVFQGIRRFDDMTVRTAIPRQVLTERLRRLVDVGILKRVPYRVPGQRERHEYRLTDKGLDLYPVLIALQAWGNQYLADPRGRRSSSPTAIAASPSNSWCAARRARGAGTRRSAAGSAPAPGRASSRPERPGTTPEASRAGCGAPRRVG